MPPEKSSERSAFDNGKRQGVAYSKSSCGNAGSDAE